jgi:hypothetical protein
MGMGTLHFQIETFILGSFQSFLLVGWCDGPIKMAQYKLLVAIKKFGKNPHLIT